MTSLRYRIERELWAADVRVAVMVSDSDAPQVTTFPIFLPYGVSVKDIERELPDIAGRLGLPPLRCAWRDDGLLELHVPKTKRQAVSLSTLTVEPYGALPWLLGITTRGDVFESDLATWPHGLVAGATGSGKSTAVNAALCHLLRHRTPRQVRTVIFDPKQVDFAAIAQAPHNMAHITDMDAAEGVLGVLVRDMNQRMATFSRAGVRDIDAYNAKADVPLPRVLVIFDELAAAMDMHGKQLEPLLMVLLQQSRAAGIHFLLLLQRPDGDVLPVRMRNNLTVRLTFKLSDPSASRLVLNDASACDLLGRGDGLLRDADGIVTRFQAPLVSDSDITRTQQIAKTMLSPTYDLAGLRGTVGALPSLEGLSEYDAAVLLCERLDWISPKDLLEHEIVSSRSQGKKVMTALREGGYIGGHDPAMNKSPVVKRRSQATTQRGHHSHRDDHGEASENAVSATNDHDDHDSAHDDDRVVN